MFLRKEESKIKHEGVSKPITSVVSSPQSTVKAALQQFPSGEDSPIALIDYQTGKVGDFVKKRVLTHLIYVSANINEVQGHFTINSYLPAVSFTTRTFLALSGRVSVAVLLAGTVTS